MAKYRVKENPRRYFEMGDETLLPPVGHVFDWDGETLDADGEVLIWLGGGDGRYVIPESVELVEPEVKPKVEVIEEEVVTVQKTYVLRLTEDEAHYVRNRMAEDLFNSNEAGRLFDVLEEVLG